MSTNTRRQPNVRLLLGQRRRLWANVKPILVQCLMLDGWFWYRVWVLFDIELIMLIVGSESESSCITCQHKRLDQCWFDVGLFSQAVVIYVESSTFWL